MQIVFNYKVGRCMSEVLKTLNTLNPKRILSIDAFRGITFLIMIFVNELHGVSGMPGWMKHMPADVDGMSVPDVVFPAFLFIVGMSIPFGLNSRLLKGDSFLQLQGHILYRAFGLILMGFFMVNAEDGFNEQAMGMSIHLWSLLFYAAILLTWGVYRFEDPVVNRTLKALGILMIVALGFIYRAGDGTHWMTPQWWGILGLIGWAYLAACILYQLSRGSLPGVLASIAACVAYYAIAHMPAVTQSPVLAWLFSQDGQAGHTSIVLCGLACTLIFFDAGRQESEARRFALAGTLLAALLAAGYALRPFYKISKIYATPSWCLYSAAICIAIFGFLYWLIDMRKTVRWVDLVEPAASNPLVTYLVPFVVFAGLTYMGIGLPAVLKQGATGFFYCVAYALAVFWVVSRMNRFNIKLKL